MRYIPSKQRYFEGSFISYSANGTFFKFRLFDDKDLGFKNQVLGLSIVLDDDNDIESD